MNWKGFGTRMLMIAVALPVLAVAVLVLPYFHHLAFNLIVVAATVAGAFEMVSLFRSRSIPTSTRLAPILSASLPAGAWLEIAGFIPPGWMGIWMPAAMCIILVRGVFFQDAKKLVNVLPFATSSFFTFLYPGFFLSWIVRMSSLPDPSLMILFFLCLVFGNDMSAYFVGSLWGESTRLNLPVSPQKSLVGFIGGYAGSFIIVGFFLLFGPGWRPFSVPLYFVLGFATGTTVIVGDLLESGLKRSAGVKDSGVVIPGRGGMLDSVDSMIFTAPLFFYFVTLVVR
ncbi:MAG TPA: phosphatidate cytidylyltransferase [Spirochaetia bacterium]